jgi:hypothetical protein
VKNALFQKEEKKNLCMKREKGGKEILEDERDFSDSHFTRLAPCLLADRPEK